VNSALFLVAQTGTHEIPPVADNVSVSYIGGFRVRGVGVTPPLGRLTVNDGGIAIGLRGPILHRVGVRWAWPEIDRVEPLWNALAHRQVGAAFYGPSRLVFASRRPGVAEQILEDVMRYAPGKLDPDRRSVAYPFVVVSRRADSDNG
jgi:hypothetical protein